MFSMTVIAGLETTVGENAVVIGLDRLDVNGEILIAECIRHIASDPTYSLSSCFRFLEEKGLDRLKLKLGRKIEFSQKNNSAIAHTGVKNDAHDQVSKLLLDPKEFLKQDSFLADLLFPLGCPRELKREFIEAYRKSFNLDLRLLARFIPEVKRIFDINLAKRNEFDFKFFKIAYWDVNYNPELSEYLFAKLFGEDKQPKLFDVTYTGAALPRQYYAKGCGRTHALEYMRKRLGTQEGTFFYPAESQIENKVCLEEAIDIVKGAITHAGEKNDFCKGCDYLVLTKERMTTYFSDEKGTYEIDLLDLIDRRIKSIRDEIEQLASIRKRYLDQRPS